MSDRDFRLYIRLSRRLVGQIVDRKADRWAQIRQEVDLASRVYAVVAEVTGSTPRSIPDDTATTNKLK
jgi:hypothetical protein